LPEIKAYAPGIYARSEELVQAIRDLNRGRTVEEAVEEQRLADVRAFVEIQREAGLDYLRVRSFGSSKPLTHSLSAVYVCPKFFCSA